MVKFKGISVFLFLAAVGIGVVQLYGAKAMAQSSYYAAMGCTGCHLTTPTTCAGCHHHSGTIAATANKTSYTPGETVTITMTSSGARSGWIGARLYNQSGVEIARSNGAQSGMGSSTLLPASLSAPAPDAAGTYSWRVAYLGNEDGNGTGDVHSEKSVSVTVTVSAPVDAAAPTIGVFTMPATSDSLTVPVTALTATDNVAVTGYMVTTSATPPLASAAGWSQTAPVSANAPAAGSVTFYAWARDAAGNVSASLNSTVNITLVTQNQSSVTITGAGSGSVTSSPVGISCVSGSPTGCSASFDSTTSVVFTESTSNGSVFAGRGGDCAVFGTSSTCTLTMSTARNVTATFNAGAMQAKIGSTGYSTLTSAYSAAAGGETIKIVDTTIPGDMTIDKEITLDGGYDAALSTKTGNPTLFSGSLTVGAGALTANDIAVM